MDGRYIGRWIGRQGRAVARRLPSHAQDASLRALRGFLEQVPRSAWPTHLRTPGPQPAGVGAEGAGPVASIPGQSRLDTRRDNIFAVTGPDVRILEIGPAHNPILPKREGFDVATADYLDRGGLIEKYRAFSQYDPNDIEVVDYVIPPDGRLTDVIDEEFGLVLASHVIEHTTSLIDFVCESARLLQSGGALALVVPDNRFCFDRFRERSALSAVIDASIYPHRVHTLGTLTEFGLNAVRHGGTTSWRPGHRGNYDFAHTPETIAQFIRSATSGSYVDVHHWVFTPYHMRLLLHDLAELGHIPLREAHFHDTVGHEFFLCLTADGPGPRMTREELVTRADAELHMLDTPTW